MGLVAKLDHVADVEAPSRKRSRLRFDDVAGAKYGESDSSTWHLHGADDESVAVDERHVDRETHPDGVDPSAAVDHEGAIDAIAAEESAPFCGAIGGVFSGGEDSCVAHQPRHVMSMARNSAVTDSACPTLGPFGSGTRATQWMAVRR